MLFTLTSLLAFLTSPVPPLPPVHLVCNTRGTICAIVVPEARLTTVVRREGTGSSVMWTAPRADALFLSEDGAYVLFGARDCLAVKWFHSGDIYLTFISQNHTTSVRLRDLFPNTWDSSTNTERRDASHFVEYDQMFFKWGDLLGFDPQGRFRIKLVKDGVVLIDPATGKVTRNGA